MEHTIRQPLELASPWRARAFLAAAIAALELVVILAIAIALVARPLTHRVKSVADQKAATVAAKPKPAAAKKAAVPAHAMLSRGETAVLVLNGNGRTGAAGAEADHVRNLGYPVTAVANASRIGYTRTLVMYRPGYAAEAQRLAKDAGIRLVTPLDGMRPTQLKGARTVIVVGSSS
jgi:LytR cell envelope-related transcriptional attenuator